MPKVLRVRGTEGTVGHGRAVGVSGTGSARRSGLGYSGDAGGSGWTLYPLHPLYPLPALKLLNLLAGLHCTIASLVPPAHPAVPVPSLCKLRSFFGVLTHNCTPDIWHS